ncbi:SDR family oxidoreductase [Streptomyces acidiscabies]|uniref:SDR family oxidoreductase n=1 Tax=Streptomyces acidiscabies TaxID=42234 RepID=UPI000969A008|nr:SDR family oxidoreductase [Streptomyces acidiscabies]GAV37464.1 enoyl-[acyl-carrier-protein] reductase [NADPH] [Streptomyces acidiscabies]
MTYAEIPAARDLAGRVALVTGGGKGVGAAISRELARHGAHVIVNYFHSPGPAQETVAAIRAAGGSAEALRATVAKPEAVAEMFEAVADTHGGLDVLVNNAARGVFARYDELTDREWQRALDTNVHGARWCALGAVPLLERRGGGTIVNVSSIGAGLAMDNYFLVGVCKAALEAMTRYLAADLGPLGIRVNTASAGLLDNSTATLFPQAEALRRVYAGAAPLGRVGTEEELARLVAFLASPQSGWVSGQSFLADGGLSVGRAMLTPRVGAASVEAPVSESETVAVVGMGVVAPGVDGPDALWERLVEGRPVFTEPGERFTLDDFWSAERGATDRTYSRVAGYAHGTGDFLTAWLRTALLQCGPSTGLRAACFVGAWNEGSQHVEESVLVEAVAEGTGSEEVRSMLRRRYPYAGVLADHLPLAAARAALEGILPAGTPVQIVDTACSSSLYAIDLGAKSVLDGDCDVAYCGGAFSQGPRYNVLFAQLNGLSRSGRVRAFGADADGVLFSDGAGLVALKRLDRARADGDRVLAVLAGFGAASDGRGKAVHAPNRTGQERALRRARAVNTVPAGQLDWVVAHATGTPVGDAVERSVLEEASPGVLCTSNKSVVGHTGWAAGVLSVVHALQGLAHSTVPAQVPYDGIAPSALRIPAHATPLPRQPDRPRTVGVSSFGFGGTNAHLLLQDESTPRSQPPVLDGDPVVVVGWSAHLPGTPDEAEVLRRLAAGLPLAERSFGVPYPVPPVGEVRMPPRTAAAIDPAQLMALQVAARLAAFWEGLAETTGVITAHTGVPVNSADMSVRCYARSLDGKAVEGFVETVLERTPAADEDTLAGLMPNVVPARVAAAHDLHGLTMAVDTGPTSGRTTLRTAQKYLSRGELDLALVLGANGGSTPLFARLHGLPELALAEGAFALVLTRASIARSRGWAVLSPLDDLLSNFPDRQGFATDRTYLAADDLIDAIRQLPLDEPRLTRRHTVAWVLSGAVSTPTTRLAPDTLVLSDSTVPELASTSRLLTLRPGDDPQASVEKILAENPQGFRHLRVLTDLRTAPAWPAPPSEALLAVQEAAFLATRELRDSLVDAGTLGVAVLTGSVTSPHAHLFTGFVKSLAWELTGCTPLALLTDAGSAEAGLAALEGELGRAREGLPVVAHRDGVRLVQRLREDDVPVGAVPLAPGAVVVATGGARGITAACMIGLAQRVPVRLHLIGSSRVEDVPEELSAAGDGELAGLRAEFIAAELVARPGVSVREINQRFERLLNARESRLNLARLRELCGVGNVHFHTADVTDAAAVRRVAERIGRVDLLVNGAGVHHPGDITRKDLPGMRRVRDVKLAGYHHLRDAFSGVSAPRLWCNFGSVTGLAGLPGESDYSPANDFLAGAAEAAEGDGEFTIAWTIWDETGLGSGSVVQSYTARTARLSRMTTAEGVAHFLEELARPRRDRLVTFVGEAEHTSFDRQFPGLRASPGLPSTLGLPPAPGLPGSSGLRVSPGPSGSSGLRPTPGLPDSPGLQPSPGLPSSLDLRPALGLPGSPGLRTSPGLPATPGLPPTPDLPDSPGLRASPGLPGSSGLRPTPGLPASPRLPGSPGLLGEPYAPGRWPLSLDIRTHPFLLDHTIDGRPTLPGMMLADLAVQAARSLAPELPVRAVENLVFSAWVRARADGTPVNYRVTARATGTADTRSVAVLVHSDTVAPDGRVLARDREHFRAVVRLGGPAPLPVPTGEPGADWAPVADPYYDDASPALLTGVFRATEDWRAGPGGSSCRWRPGAGLPRLGTPCVLLDGLARTRWLARTVAVPHHAARITLYTDADDTSLALAHPEGLVLAHCAATGVSTARTADGRVLAQITGLTGTELASK